MDDVPQDWPTTAFQRHVVTLPAPEPVAAAPGSRGDVAATPGVTSAGGHSHDAPTLPANPGDVGAAAGLDLGVPDWARQDRDPSTWAPTSSETLWPPPSFLPPPPGGWRPDRRRRSRLIVLSALGAVAVIAAGVAGWLLLRSGTAGPAVQVPSTWGGYVRVDPARSDAIRNALREIIRAGDPQERSLADRSTVALYAAGPDAAPTAVVIVFPTPPEWTGSSFANAVRAMFAGAGISPTVQPAGSAGGVSECGVKPTGTEVICAWADSRSVGVLAEPGRLATPAQVDRDEISFRRLVR